MSIPTADTRALARRLARCALNWKHTAAQHLRNEQFWRARARVAESALAGAALLARALVGQDARLPAGIAQLRDQVLAAAARAWLPRFSDDELREHLADLAHQQWSGWMAYQFGKGALNPDGTWTMPAWAVARWTRQLGTAYADLPASEQDNDRIEADRVLALLEEAGVIASRPEPIPTSPPPTEVSRAPAP
jgi:hypothetical protein